ncbi:MAG: hypothetical protein WBA74_00475, partial [Cyclobacteriaceae bacterium]
MILRLRYVSQLSIIILSILLTSCLVNDADSPEPEDIFVKYYGGEGTESIVELGYLSASDEYLIFGNSSSNDTFGEGLNDFFLVKTSADGSVADVRFPDFSEGRDSANETASSMKVAIDQIQLVGTTEVRLNDLGVFGNKMTFYLLYDFAFNEISRGVISMPGQDVEGNDIVATSDGNYVILSTVGDALSGQRNIMYTKITPGGDIVWQRSNNLPGDDVGVSIIELTNGNLAICARTERTSVNGYRGVNVLYL